MKCIEESKFLTVEAFASEVAHTALSFLTDSTASAIVRVSKPSAILNAESAEVQVTRTLADFDSKSSQDTPSIATKTVSSVVNSSATSLLAPQGKSLPHIAAIAIGANIGDRFANIEAALRLLEAPGADLEKWTGSQRVLVVDRSFMYETAPMYVEDQP